MKNLLDELHRLYVRILTDQDTTGDDYSRLFVLGVVAMCLVMAFVIVIVAITAVS